MNVATRHNIHTYILILREWHSLLTIYIYIGQIIDFITSILLRRTIIKIMLLKLIMNLYIEFIKIE